MPTAQVQMPNINLMYSTYTRTSLKAYRYFRLRETMIMEMQDIKRQAHWALIIPTSPFSLFRSSANQVVLLPILQNITVIITRTYISFHWIATAHIIPRQ